MPSRHDERVALAARVRAEHARRKQSRPPLSYAALETALSRAEELTAAGDAVREKHRRRHRPDREADIRAVLEGMADVMVPLRSEAGRLASDPALDARFGERLRLATRALRDERRKLYKLR